MEKQIVLVVSSLKGDDCEYFSKWKFGRRVPGSRNPYNALECKRPLYESERLSATDIPILLQVLIEWSA